jgi:hypothetical protein
MSLADDLTRALSDVFTAAVPVPAAPLTIPGWRDAEPAPAEPQPNGLVAPEDEPDDDSPYGVGEPAPARSARHPYGRRSGRRAFSRRNTNWRAVEAITVETNPRTGNLEIRFPNKPVEAVRRELGLRGWRWNGSAGCWYHANSESARQFAHSLAD